MAKVSESAEKQDYRAEFNESFETMEMKHVDLYNENRDDVGPISTQPSGGSVAHKPRGQNFKFQSTSANKYTSSSPLPVRRLERFSQPNEDPRDDAGKNQVYRSTANMQRDSSAPAQNMRPESLRPSVNVVFDQESTHDREIPSIFSSINHKDHADVHEFREFGNNQPDKHLNLETIPSRPEVGLIELPENDELKGDRRNPTKDKTSFSGTNRSATNNDNPNVGSQSRLSSGRRNQQQGENPGSKRHAEITTNKKHFVEDDFEARMGQLNTDSDGDNHQKEFVDHSFATPSRKKGTGDNNLREQKYVEGENSENIVTQNQKTTSKNRKSATSSYIKIEGGLARMISQENEQHDPNGFSKHIQAQETLNDMKDSMPQKESSGVPLVKERPSESKKKKTSRFTQVFFKNQIQNRTGIPTLTAKKRETSDIYNLEKLGIDPKKQNLSTSNVAQRRNNVGNFSDTDAKKDPLKSQNANKLMEEFENIQMNMLFRQKLEMFILLFNQDAERGINFLIANELIEDSPEIIARIFLTTEGLNKDMIGKYLGSHKERNLKVLKAYCHALDFRGLEIDQSMRLLLSRFKLPGEAQQIERIVEGFAKVYHQDNPNAFVDEDTPFILAYSMLLLATDAHSEKIQKNRKMTKQQFVNNNIKVCKVDPAYLGRIYDNITRLKFETKTDYIEQVYNRLQMDTSKGELQGETLKIIMNRARDVIQGALFRKYGRRGKPHERYVWISEKEDFIYWKNPKQSNPKIKSIPMHEVKDIHVGYNSTKILKHNKAPQEFDNVIFSIESERRTLDLQAPDPKVRAKWEEYFRLLLIQRKERDKEQVQKMKDSRTKDRERISEIWKTDILPNFHQHWDYETHLPKGVQELRTKKLKDKKPKKVRQKSRPKSSRGAFASIFFCRASDSPSPIPNTRSQRNDPKTSIEDADSEEEDLRDMCKSKSLLLVHVWRFGIPEWLRKTIWPITIGNRLEITPTLYEILLMQARGYLHESVKTNASITNYLKSMEKDLPETFPKLEYFQSEERKQSLINILEAFIFYRPDVGYVKGMSNIAAILLLFCPEYEAFACFINLTHSHHFISFFRGDLREVEWRIQFFNSYFSKELPQLYNHFKGLDLSSENFLLDWFVSLFSTAFSDVDIIARIWDCFLLDGEVFAITTTLAILKYYELELKMMTFEAAVKFLKKLPDVVNEKALFSAIESLKIPVYEYQKNLEKQSVAQINTHIHQALLL